MKRICNFYMFTIAALTLSLTGGLVRAADENLRDRVAYKTYVFGFVSAVAVIALLTIGEDDEPVSP